VLKRHVIGLTAVLGIGPTDIASAQSVVAPYCGGSDLQTCASVGVSYQEVSRGTFLVQLISTNLGVSRQVYRVNAPLGVRDVNGRLFGPRSRIHSERNGVAIFSLLRLDKGVRDATRDAARAERDEIRRMKFGKPRKKRR
jgi:hypothetical protein